MAKTQELSTIKKKTKLTKKAKTSLANQGPSIKYSKDDYVIIKANGKYKLGTAFAKGRLLLEEGVEDDDTSITLDFEENDVVACLGKNPPVGKDAFGCKLEFYDQTFTDKHWGPIHFFRKIEDEREMKYLKQVLNKAYSVLSEHKASRFLPLTRTDLRMAKGKYAGMYSFNYKRGDKMTLRPVDMKDRKYMLYVIIHEAGHGVWYRCVPSDVKVIWTDLFHKRVRLHTSTEKQLKAMAKALVSYDDFKSYAKDECDEDDKKVLKEAFAYVKRVHKLNEKQLEALVKTKGGKAILDYWPKSADVGLVSPDVTEYSMESVEEFFAESFAYFLTKKSLPKDITKEMEHTLKNLIKDSEGG